MTLHPDDFKNAVFDAYNYDVPQHRERVILIGIKQDEGFSIDNFYANLSQCVSGTHKTVRDAIGALPPLYPLDQVVKTKDDMYHINAMEKMYIILLDIVVRETLKCLKHG